QARPEEMKYIYQMLQSQGELFSVDKGWPDSSTSAGVAEIPQFNIVRRMFGIEKLIGRRLPATLSDEIAPPVEHHSILKVIELLYGPIPKRKKLRKQFETEEEEKVELNPFESAELQELLEQMRKQREELAEYEDVDLKGIVSNE
ncbi:hypothetical protein KKC32_00035, partial [Patescibacteria group bacterium]|nr:hypothetical protein [Patescibacteria group bacterium]